VNHNKHGFFRFRVNNIDATKIRRMVCRIEKVGYYLISIIYLLFYFFPAPCNFCQQPETYPKWPKSKFVSEFCSPCETCTVSGEKLGSTHDWKGMQRSYLARDIELVNVRETFC
jgi:hypothetical protein